MTRVQEERPNNAKSYKEIKLLEQKKHTSKGASS
jgi:hypothetical protein